MAETPSRVFALLATSGFSSSEIREFIRFVKWSDEHDTYQMVSRIRALIRHSDTHKLSGRETTATFTRSPDAVVREIQKLANDSNIGVSEAVEKISGRLRLRFPDRLDPLAYFSSKEGFRRWIKRCVEDYGEGPMLSAAVEALTKPGASDWRLSS